MRYYVTGASGFIGKALCEELEYRGEHVFRHSHKCNQPDDMLSYEPDVIIHCGAEQYDETRMLGSNILYTLRLLACAQKLTNLRQFIHIGTSSEYGQRVSPMKETDALRPHTWYGATKAAATMLCLASPVPTLVVRPFTVYGPGEPDFKLIPCLFRAYFDKTPLRLTPGVHDFIHIEDFLEGLLHFAGMSGINDVVNLGTGIQYSNEEVANMFEKITEHKFERVYEDKGKIHDMAVWVCDPRYAQNKYGFKTGISLCDGLTKYVDFRRE